MFPYLKYLLLWVALISLYLLSAGSAAWSEMCAGILVAGGAVLLCRRLRNSFRRQLQFKPCWLIPLWRIIPALFLETWQLYRALAVRLAGRSVEGRFIEHHFMADTHDPYASWRFALMTFGVCITPNSYLVSFDPKRGKVTVRQLVGKEISMTDRKFLELP